MNSNKEEQLELTNYFIAVLNGAVAADAEALHKLVEYRVPCNSHLVEHPTVQVRTEQKSTTGGATTLVEEHSVGMLGVLNALLGIDDKGAGPLAADFDDTTGMLTKFVMNPHFGKPKA